MSSQIIVIGLGRVGGSIVSHCRAQGIGVSGVAKSEFNDWLLNGDLIAEGAEHTTIFIAVKDAELEVVSQKLAEAKTDSLKNVLVAHLNGSRSASVLDACAQHGAICVAAHPFQTFNNSNPEALIGIGWGIECAAEHFSRVAEVAEALSGSPFHLNLHGDTDKLNYHAAAVAASNFTYAAYQLARNLAQSVGIPEADFLIPIMQRTLRNAEESLRNQTAFDVTGPLVRGDLEAVKKQLGAVPEEHRKQYVNLSLALLEVVRGKISDVTYAVLLRELSE